MRDYIHVKPGQETRSIPFEFMVREEGRLDLDGREALYLVGDSPIGSACVGAGIISYVFVPGFIAEWHMAVSVDGYPLSRVEPVADEGARGRVRAFIARIHPGLQVCF